MSARAGDQDIFETSSFSSLIEQEEKEEIIPLDLHTAALIGDYDTVRGLYSCFFLETCSDPKYRTASLQKAPKN